MTNMNWRQSQDLDPAEFAVYNLNELLDAVEGAALVGLFDSDGDTRTREQIAIDAQNNLLHLFNRIGDPMRQIDMLAEQGMQIWMAAMLRYDPVIAH